MMLAPETMPVCAFPSGALLRIENPALQRDVAAVAEALHDRADELAVGLTRAIPRELPPYPFDVLVANCAANVRAILSAIFTSTGFDTSAATKAGICGARDGMPLSSVMEAYRVGFRELWEAVGGAPMRVQANAEVLVALTAQLLSAQDVFTEAMAAGYRQEQARRLIADEAERSMLVDALLHGRISEELSLWEVADYLQLPAGGPFIVIAAELPVGSTEALANIESKLRPLDVVSAWHLLPDVQVGIMHVRTDVQRARVLALLSRMATTRVGMSERFNDLRGSAEALRHARMMLRAGRKPGVAVFDDSLLTTAVVSGPEEIVKLVAPILERFADLGADERETLFRTFRLWVDCGGSSCAASKSLCCHPNTVRYRLRRIEQRTGRSLSRPRDVAELCVVFEVQRSLV